MLIIYSLIGSYMEKIKPPIFHETGIIIIIGIIIGYCIKKWNEELVEGPDSLLLFPKSLFFEVLLPLIIFSSGYNMKRKKFFSNSSNIVRFGILATILTFLIYSLLTWVMFRIFTFTVQIVDEHNPEITKTEEFDLGITMIMYLCSILCSSDIIAAITIIKFED